MLPRGLARIRPTIVVHGGAWAIPDALREASLEGVRAAAEAGFSCLEHSGSALDAVEAAVNCLEANPAFNAGRGASLNKAGEVELDAVIVDGRTLAAGAVAGLGPVLHPVSVARKVMEQTEHVLLVGPGATAFAVEMGVPILDPSVLVTPEARAEWDSIAAFNQTVSTFYNTERAVPPPPGHDTVGAVALDAHGDLAAATSTGGITFKRVGRVGDSPLLGAGALADNERGAISTTGHGESILKYTLASRVLGRMESGRSDARGVLALRSSPTGAVAVELEAMYARLDGGSGGAVCLDPSGDVGIGFTSSRMAWAARGGLRRARDAVVSGIDRTERTNPGLCEVVLL